MVRARAPKWMRVFVLLLSLLLCAGSPRVDGAASSMPADAAGHAAARWSPLESAFPPLTSPASESTTSTSSSTSSSSSSSSTNSTNSPTAAAAAATATTHPVPKLLPLIALSLQLAWDGTTLELHQSLVADLAVAMGVSTRRILLTELLVYDSGRVAAHFAVTPALHSSAVSAQSVASKFLADATANETFATLSILKHIGNETALATPSSAATLLQEVRFALQLDMAALPGGSVDAFSERLVADLAPICGVPEWRLHPLSVGAPSVQVAFTVAPRLVVTDLQSNVAVQHFVDAVANSTSALYSGTITGHAVAGTVRVGTPGAMDSVDSSDEGYWTRTRILCAAAGAGAGVFILLGGGIWICVSEKNNRAAKLAAAATLAKNKELASVRTPLYKGGGCKK